MRSKRRSSSSARRRASARERSNRRPNITRFSRPERISSTAANCPVSPSSSRTAGASRHHVPAEHLGTSRVGGQQRRQHPQRAWSCLPRSARAGRTPCPRGQPGRRRRAQRSSRSSSPLPRPGRQEGRGSEADIRRPYSPVVCSGHERVGAAARPRRAPGSCPTRRETPRRPQTRAHSVRVRSRGRQPPQPRRSARTSEPVQRGSPADHKPRFTADANRILVQDTSRMLQIPDRGEPQ